jgi:hypothetical protein
VVTPISSARSAKVSHRVGVHVGWSDTGQPLVDYPENVSGPLAARTTVALDRTAVPATLGSEVLLAFDGDDAERPIIVGVLERPESPTGDGSIGPAKPLEVHIDGQRVVLNAEDEIVLSCGKASITLRRNGRVVVRGTYVETCSEGVNRIKGGSVAIN